MFRKIACILSAVGIFLMIRVSAQAAGGTVFQSLEQETGQTVPWDKPMAGDETLGCRGNILAMNVVAEESGLPDTGDYPAPIITAMGISLGIVFLLVMTENLRK